MRVWCTDGKRYGAFRAMICLQRIMKKSVDNEGE